MRTSAAAQHRSTASAAPTRPARAALDAEHVSQYTRGVVARIDLAVDSLDAPVGADQKAHPLGIARLEIVTGAIGGGGLAPRVAQELEAEAVFGRKGGVLGRGVEARAEDYDAVVVEVLLMVAEPAPFKRSARGVGLGKKP